MENPRPDNGTSITPAGCFLVLLTLVALCGAAFFLKDPLRGRPIYVVMTVACSLAAGIFGIGRAIMGALGFSLSKDRAKDRTQQPE
jgi:hypothetical protein